MRKLIPNKLLVLIKCKCPDFKLPVLGLNISILVFLNIYHISSVMRLTFFSF